MPVARAEDGGQESGSSSYVLMVLWAEGVGRGHTWRCGGANRCGNKLLGDGAAVKTLNIACVGGTKGDAVDSLDLTDLLGGE